MTSRKQMEEVINRLKTRVIQLESQLADVGFDVPSQNVDERQGPFPWAQRYLSELDVGFPPTGSSKPQ